MTTTATPTVTDSKSDIQAVLDEAGIDYAASWNRDKLVGAWNDANPTTDDQIHMSFGPTSTKFMTDAGYKPERTSDTRGWFVIGRSQAVSLLEDLDAEITKQKTEGSKATARNLERAVERISTRL